MSHTVLLGGYVLAGADPKATLYSRLSALTCDEACVARVDPPDPHLSHRAYIELNHNSQSYPLTLIVL